MLVTDMPKLRVFGWGGLKKDLPARASMLYGVTPVGDVIVLGTIHRVNRTWGSNWYPTASDLERGGFVEIPGGYDEAVARSDEWLPHVIVPREAVLRACV